MPQLKCQSLVYKTLIQLEHLDNIFEQYFYQLADSIVFDLKFVWIPRVRLEISSDIEIANSQIENLKNI